MDTIRKLDILKHWTAAENNCVDVFTLDGSARKI